MAKKSKKILIPVDANGQFNIHGYVQTCYGTMDEHRQIVTYKIYNPPAGDTTDVQESVTEFKARDFRNRIYHDHGTTTCRLAVFPRSVENFEFDATMQINSYSFSKSGGGINLQDTNNTRYYMMLTDFIDLIKTTTLTHGRTPHMTWTFRKQGTAIGVIPFKQ